MKLTIKKRLIFVGIVVVISIPFIFINMARIKPVIEYTDGFLKLLIEGNYETLQAVYGKSYGEKSVYLNHKLLELKNKFGNLKSFQMKTCKIKTKNNFLVIYSVVFDQAKKCEILINVIGDSKNSSEFQLNDMDLDQEKITKDKQSKYWYIRSNYDSL
jgi:hypothetical protein